MRVVPFRSPTGVSLHRPTDNPLLSHLFNSLIDFVFMLNVGIVIPEVAISYGIEDRPRRVDLCNYKQTILIYINELYGQNCTVNSGALFA